VFLFDGTFDCLDKSCGIVYDTEMNEFRAVFDTNVLVSGLKSRRGASFKLLSMLDSPLFSLHLSVPLAFEYEDVLNRGELGISRQDAKVVLDFICSVAIHQPIFYLWRPYLTDAKDDIVLEAAVAAQATHIVTANTKDFAGIGRFGIQAVWPADFLIQLGVHQ
jgi:predicted nucleic acid-binding protein